MQKIGFIGAGNMANAIISGLINSGYQRECLSVADINQTLLSQIKADFGIKIFTDNIQLANACEVLILAVKPQVILTICQQLANNLPKNILIISIAAGVKTVNIYKNLGAKYPLVRVMPNTPALFNQGISGAFAADISAENTIITNTTLQAIGQYIWVETEDLIDVVTAISGSGPAYFFLMLEAMNTAGINLGLSAKTAQKLSVQTMLGAAIMLDKSGVTPDKLREQVTSDKGTTQAAITAFKQQNFAQIIATAISAAHARSVQIGTELT